MSRLRLFGLAGAAAGFACLAVPAGLSRVQAHGAYPDAPPQAPPPQARPGECYGRVLLPPVYGTGRHKVLEREAWAETVRTPPVVKRVAHKVLVKPERTEKVKVPAVYRNETVWTTRPGAKRKLVTPARYKTVHEKVLVEAGHAEWRATDAPLAYGESRGGQTLLQATGEVVCRVWVPDRYETHARKVLVSKADVRWVEGPPRKVKTVKKVLVKAAGWTERKVPAVYRTEYEKTVVAPAGTRTVRHPAAYRTVESRVLVKPSRPGWAQVLCGGPINPAFMARVQAALIDRGFDPGPPDGVERPQVYAALRMFQRQNHMAEGQLTVEAAQALGVL